MDDQIDRAIEETRAFLAEPPAPDVTRAVMSRIDALEPAPAPRRAGVLERLAGWLWAPRQLSVRPAFALCGAAMVLVLLLTPYVRPGATAEGDSDREAQLFVQF